MMSYASLFLAAKVLLWSAIATSVEDVAASFSYSCRYAAVSFDIVDSIATLLDLVNRLTILPTSIPILLYLVAILASMRS